VLAVEGAGVDLGEVDEHAGAQGALLGEELAQAREESFVAERSYFVR
jgi:hypothetical protein